MKCINYLNSSFNFTFFLIKKKISDLGFEPQVNAILDFMPSSNLKSLDENEAMKQEGHRQYRTTMMFSATMPAGVERLSRKYLRRPTYIIIGEIGRAVERIEQRVEFCHNEGEKVRKMTSVRHVTPKKKTKFRFSLSDNIFFFLFAGSY